jgi:hypothetical protein
MIWCGDRRQHPTGLWVSPTSSPAYGARPVPSGKSSRCSRARLRRLTALTGCRRPGSGSPCRWSNSTTTSAAHRSVSADMADGEAPLSTREIPNAAAAAGGIAIDGGGINHDCVTPRWSRIQFERGHIFQAAETAPSLSANDARWADQAPSSMRPCDRSALSCGHVAAARRHRRMAFKHDMRKPPSESLSDVVTGKFKERWAASR